MVRWLVLVLVLGSCAFPTPPPPTVVNRAPFPPQPALDRPFLVPIPVTGYELARFGFGVAVSKRYEADKILGYYLTCWDWVTGTLVGRTFWEGRGATNGRELAVESTGPRYILGAQGWAGLDLANGALTTGAFPPGSEPSDQVTADGRVVLLSRPDGYAQPAALRTFSLVTGQFLGPAVRFPPGNHRGDVTMFHTKLTADRFWIETGNNEVYRYDPQTQELILVYSEPLGSTYHLVLLGAYGPRFLVSRYHTGGNSGDATDAKVLVFDAADPTVTKSVTVAVPARSWISQGIEAQGTYYLLVLLYWDANTTPVDQIWTFDPVTEAAAPTGLSFSLWANGELAARDDNLVLFSTMTKTRTLSVGRANLTTKTVTYSEHSLVQAVQP